MMNQLETSPILPYNPLLTVTGPSGSGKTLLLKELCKEYNFSKIVSVTTRSPRPGEIEGEDYYFINNEEYCDLKENNNLIQAVHFNNRDYGTSKSELARISRLGKIPVVIVEPTGIPQFEAICCKYGFCLKTIFITAPYEVLIERYLFRMRDSLVSEENIAYHAMRIAAIKEEKKWGGLWTYSIKFKNPGSDLTDIHRIAKAANSFLLKDSKEQELKEKQGKLW